MGQLVVRAEPVVETLPTARMRVPRNLSNGQSGLPPQASRQHGLRRIAPGRFLEFPLFPGQGFELPGKGVDP